jgi:hypothetical protein
MLLDELSLRGMIREMKLQIQLINDQIESVDNGEEDLEPRDVRAILNSLEQRKIMYYDQVRKFVDSEVKFLATSSRVTAREQIASDLRKVQARLRSALADAGASQEIISLAESVITDSLAD